MKTTALTIWSTACLTLGIMSSSGALANPPQAVITKVTAAWDQVKTYRCTITAHEVLGSAVQDRVYRFYFSKPLDTRSEIVGGDSRGSVGVWRGGETVTGHRGGILRSIKLKVDVHSRLATTLRGTTFAESNMGAMLAHLKSIPPRSLEAHKDGNTTVVTALISDARKNGGVDKEIYYFGADNLPQEYEEYQGTQLVKRIVYSDLKVNVTFPSSLFDL